MIVDFFLDIINNILHGFLSMLPDWTMHLPEGLATMLEQLLTLNDVLPVQEALTVIGLGVGMTIAMWTFKFIIKLVDWIAGIVP